LTKSVFVSNYLLIKITFLTMIYQNKYGLLRFGHQLQDLSLLDSHIFPSDENYYLNHHIFSRGMATLPKVNWSL